MVLPRTKGYILRIAYKTKLTARPAAAFFRNALRFMNPLLR